MKDLVEPVPLRPRAGSLTAAWVCSSSKQTAKKSSSSLTRPWAPGTPPSGPPPSARAASIADNYTVSKAPFQACLRSCHFLARSSSHPSRGKPSPAGARKARPDLPNSFLRLPSAGAALVTLAALLLFQRSNPYGPPQCVCTGLWLGLEDASPGQPPHPLQVSAHTLPPQSRAWSLLLFLVTRGPLSCLCCVSPAACVDAWQGVCADLP